VTTCPVACSIDHYSKNLRPFVCVSVCVSAFIQIHSLVCVVIINLSDDCDNAVCSDEDDSESSGAEESKDNSVS